MTEIHVFEISRTLEISKNPDTNLRIKLNWKQLSFFFFEIYF